MKKMLTLLIATLIILSVALPASARVGDVVGQVYSTDIKAYVNGVQVKAYNIGGRTCIPIEDVTSGYAYNNNHRTLLVTSFAPNYLKECTESNTYGKIGDLVGNIYETDIKTYFYDKELPSYNIGGKTCVAIEDIGRDNTFSSVGGKYIWNPVNRTIRLEYLYDTTESLLDLLNNYRYDIKITNGVVEFIPAVSDNTHSISYDPSGLYGSMNNRPKAVIPLKYVTSEGKETVIGYNFGSDAYVFYWNDNAQCSLEKLGQTFNFFYMDSVEEILKRNGKPVIDDRDAYIKSLLESMLADNIERYDTDSYSFLMFTQPTPRGNETVLMIVTDKDGAISIFSLIPDVTLNDRINRDSVILDKSSDTVKFSLMSGENYVFNLVSGQLSAPSEPPEQWNTSYHQSGNTLTVSFTVGKDSYSWTGFVSSDKTDVTMDTIWTVDTNPVASVGIAFYPNQFISQKTMRENMFDSLSNLPIPSLTETDDIINTPEVRTAVNEVFRVSLNNMPVSGNLYRTQGNGHVDFIFSFDNGIIVSPGDVITIVYTN